jgi:hypothetical protein
MKEFIQLIGDKFLAIVVILAYIGVVVGGITTMQGFNGGFWAGIGTMIGGFLAVSMFFYGIYILIDIRDSLREIKSK